MDKKKILLILGLAGFVVMADNWVVSPLLPAISSDLGVSMASVALIIAAYMIPFGLFQLVFGYLADRFGKRQVISFAMIFFTVSTGICALAVGLTDLSIYRALTGVFAASVMPISLALIGDIFPENERQSAIGTFLGISFLGQGLSMAIGGSVAYFFNWRGVFVVYAIFSIIATALLLTIGKNIPSVKHGGGKIFKPYINLIKNPPSFVIYILVLFEGILLIGPFSFLGGFIKNVYDFNNLIIGLIMSAFGLMAIIGGRISGKVATRLGRKKTIILGLTCAAVANLIYIIFGGTLVFLIIGVGFAGLGFTLTHSTFLAIATEFASKARGVAMSLVAFFFMGGGGLGTLIGSRILGIDNFINLFAVYGTGILLLILTVSLIKKNFAFEKTT